MSSKITDQVKTFLILYKILNYTFLGAFLIYKTHITHLNDSVKVKVLLWQENIIQCTNTNPKWSPLLVTLLGGTGGAVPD